MIANIEIDVKSDYNFKLFRKITKLKKYYLYNRRVKVL